MEIRLEDDFDPSWENAKVRLKVASEIFGFPFNISMDETALAYRDFASMWHHKLCIGEAEPSDHGPLADYWREYVKKVHTMGEAEMVLYPWFHDGEEMVDPVGDMTGRNL